MSFPYYFDGLKDDLLKELPYACTVIKEIANDYNHDNGAEGFISADHIKIHFNDTIPSNVLKYPSGYKTLSRELVNDLLELAGDVYDSANFSKIAQELILLVQKP
ncbi:MAG: hypothetical protein QM613_04465 [Micrococcaceae bacterium]